MKVQKIDTLLAGGTGFVRITAADGSTGMGQLSPGDADLSAQFLHRHLAGVVLGRRVSSAEDVMALSERMWDTTYKYLGTFLCRAMCGIDTALWDLLARARGVPVCTLAGGDPQVLNAYASSMSRQTEPQEEVQRLLRARDEWGFRAAKLKVGPRRGGRHKMDQAQERTRRLIPMARERLGPDFRLMVDANGSYTVPEAVEVGRQLEDNGYCHYEEPCPHEDLEGTGRVAAALDIPVAGGEQDYWMPAFRRMVEMDAVDVVQLDVGYVGGFSRALRVCEMADQAGKPVLPHNSGASMLLFFTLHLLSTVPNSGGWLERNVKNAPSGLFNQDAVVRDGQITTPEGPGWGVQVLPQKLASARVQTSANDG